MPNPKSNIIVTRSMKKLSVVPETKNREDMTAKEESMATGNTAVGETSQTSLEELKSLILEQTKLITS